MQGNPSSTNSESIIHCVCDVKQKGNGYELSISTPGARPFVTKQFTTDSQVTQFLSDYNIGNLPSWNAGMSGGGNLGQQTQGYAGSNVGNRP